MTEVTTRVSGGRGEHQRLDHVPSLPADLRQMVIPHLQADTRNGMHRVHGTTELNETGLLENENDTMDDHHRPDFFHKDSSEEPSTSELAQDVELHKLIKEKDVEITKLTNRFAMANTDYEELQTSLAEAQMIISEQQEQIAIFRQEIALSKRNIEDTKFKNAVLASSTQEHSDEMKNIITEFGEMHSELERLRQERKTAREQMDRLVKERNFLRDKLKEGGLVLVEAGSGEYLESGDSHHRRTGGQGSRSSGSANATSSMHSDDATQLFISPMQQAATDCQSNSGSTIQQLREEKARWENYANKLVRNMIELNPEVMEAIQRGEEGEGPQTDSEKRWYAYAMRLLSNAVEDNSAKVTEFDRKLLKSMRRKNDWKKVGAVGVQSTEVSTRVNFAQTRRRKIDRLREFFQKKN